MQVTFDDFAADDSSTDDSNDSNDDDATADATPEVSGDDDLSPVDDWDAYMAAYEQELEEIVAPVIPDKTAA